MTDEPRIPEDVNEQPQANGKERIAKITLALLMVALVVGIAWFALGTFVFGKYEVKGVSMQPTLEDGQVLWGNRLKTPGRFDIVVIDNSDGKYVKNEDTQRLIKRVIGVAGDTLSVYTEPEPVAGKYIHWVQVEYDGGVTVLDDEDYGGGKLLPLTYWLGGAANFTKTVQVGEGKVFVLGDNRVNSTDSRAFELIVVDLKDIEAVIIKK